MSGEFVYETYNKIKIIITKKLIAYPSFQKLYKRG